LGGRTFPSPTSTLQCSALRLTHHCTITLLVGTPKGADPRCRISTWPRARAGAVLLQLGLFPRNTAAAPGCRTQADAEQPTLQSRTRLRGCLELSCTWNTQVTFSYPLQLTHCSPALSQPALVVGCNRARGVRQSRYQEWEGLRWEKTSKITKSNCQSIPTMPTDHAPQCHTYPLLVSLQGWYSTTSPAAYFSARSLFQRRVFLLSISNRIMALSQGGTKSPGVLSDPSPELWQGRLHQPQGCKRTSGEARTPGGTVPTVTACCPIRAPEGGPLPSMMLGCRLPWPQQNEHTYLGSTCSISQDGTKVI